MKSHISKFLLSFVIIGFVGIKYGNSQTNDIFKPTIIDFYNSVKYHKVVAKKSNNQVTGSPYIDSQFHRGYIMTLDSVVYKGVNMRYNNYKDVIEFRKSEKEVYELSNALPVLQIKLRGIVIERKNYKSNGIIKSGFFQRLSNGATSLYSQQRIVLERARNASLYNASKLANYKVEPRKWYLQKRQNEELFSFSSKKELLDILNDERGKLREYIKKEKLKLKKEDIVRIIDYYNSISN